MEGIKALLKLQEKAAGNPAATDALSDETSKLSSWWESNNFNLERCSDSENVIFETFSKLLYHKTEKMQQCKTKLLNFLNKIFEKFDAFLQKHTEYEDASSYISTLETKSVDPIIELICLSMAYQRNLRVLYYKGESLKEKTFYHDRTSSEGNHVNDEDLITIFMCENEIVPLLPVEDEDSDESLSEKSAELDNRSTNIETPNAVSFKKVDSESDNVLDVYSSISKFVNEDFDNKMTIKEHDNRSCQFEIDHDEHEEALFSEIWERPSNVPDSRQHISQNQAPPGLSKETIQDNVSNKNNDKPRRKHHESLRVAYQNKGNARSDEQAFKFHMRQPILSANGNDSLIEEEIKSNSNMNLSTSSRSYRPGISKSKSTIYSQDSESLNPPPRIYSHHVPQNIPQNIPKNLPQNIPQNTNPQYYFQSSTNPGMTLHPSPMMKFPPKPPTEQVSQPYPTQYNYPMGIVAQPPIYPPAGSAFGPNPTTLRQAHSISVYPGPNNFGSDKTIEVSKEEGKNRHSLNTPTIQAVTTASSSNLTSGSTSPPMSELRFGTGKLKFFNQQHQYGFIISEKDGSDIFFHYDDVKHTLLSKEFLRHATENYDVRFSFQILDYVGKYESSKKAVNINLLSIICNADSNAQASRNQI